MLFGRCVLVYSCSLGNTAQTERPGSAKRRGEIVGKAVVARILKTIKHRLKHRPALVAGVIVGAVAVLAIGGAKNSVAPQFEAFRGILQKAAARLQKSILDS